MSFLARGSFRECRSVIVGFKPIHQTIFEPCLKREIHQYRNIIPWKNTLELTEHLIQSVIYFNEDLLVLNKPSGVTFSRDGATKTTESEPSPEETVFKKDIKNQTKVFRSAFATSGIVSENLSLVDCLPYLKEHFGFKKLHISRVPEKCMSGVAILTTSKELVERVNQSRLHLPTGKDKYLAVVVGVPRYPQGEIKMGVQLKEHPKKGKRVIMLNEWSNNAYKRGEVRIGTFHHQTLGTGFNGLTSLVEIAVELRKYHAYRVFPALHLLTPVLGDNLFSGRVQNVMGVPMLINHFNDSADAPQKLPDDIYEFLELTPREGSIIPVHMHLSEMLLPRFYGKDKPVVLRADPPPHFEWTCEKLGLIQLEEAGSLVEI